ncbi:hypothetical protein [Algibacter sp. PT7-4]|uniref:hypothetical protein n=1 Tax=Algibacter ulvanivorans TaxID=3400999 RepID=UPI003AABCBFE
MKVNLIFVLLLCFACSPTNENESTIFNGVVASQTSCSGGKEPIFIIRLGEADSIITGTLPKAFQVPNLNIQFRSKTNTFNIFCTTDKVYPEAFNVYNVKATSN